MLPLDYYSRKDIQKAIVGSSKDREVAVRFGDSGFGKRPDTLHFESDVLELARQGATSFHISEEHWHDPLRLEPAMAKKQLDSLRKGWDLIIDIDSPNLDHSKLIAYYIIEALKFNDIKQAFVKFSGNKGFHIAVPFNSFPEIINNVQTKELFPDGPRIIAAYLIQFIKPHIKKRITELNIRTPIDEFMKIDTILISSRHMFRAPYSLHEKSGLVSIPVDADNLLGFNKELAKPENIRVIKPFIDYSKIKKQEATNLLVQALDWDSKNKSREQKDIKKTTSYEEIKDTIPEKFFPPCMLSGLNGLEDGKKRFLFILINHLRNLGWNHEQIEKRVREWNKKNPEPLREGYVLSQLAWHKRQKQKILPPNCPHASDSQATNYYKNLQICDPDSLCLKVKNPVNYAIRRTRLMNLNKKK